MVDVERAESSAATVGVQVDERFSEAIQADTLESLAKRVLAEETLPAAQVELGLVVTGDEELQQLNLKYRDVDSPTDVLSFSNLEGEGYRPSNPAIPVYLGDVIISYPRAEAQAAEAGHSVSDELSLLAVHGILHLLGYDHDEPERKAVMWQRQEEVLGKRLVD